MSLIGLPRDLRDTCRKVTWVDLGWLGWCLDRLINQYHSQLIQLWLQITDLRSCSQLLLPTPYWLHWFSTLLTLLTLLHSGVDEMWYLQCLTLLVLYSQVSIQVWLDNTIMALDSAKSMWAYRELIKYIASNGVNWFGCKVRQKNRNHITTYQQYY